MWVRARWSDEGKVPRNVMNLTESCAPPHRHLVAQYTKTNVVASIRCIFLKTAQKPSFRATMYTPLQYQTRLARRACAGLHPLTVHQLIAHQTATIEQTKLNQLKWNMSRWVMLPDTWRWQSSDVFDARLVLGEFASESRISENRTGVCVETVHTSDWSGDTHLTHVRPQLNDVC